MFKVGDTIEYRLVLENQVGVTYKGEVTHINDFKSNITDHTFYEVTLGNALTFEIGHPGDTETWEVL